jgi:hypothetical protein
MSRNHAAFYTQYHESDPVWLSENDDVIVLRNGEMRIHLTNADGSGSVLRYTSDLDDHGLDSDEKLAAAEKAGTIEWHNNPWFEVIYHDNEEGEVFIDFEEAMEYARKVLAEYEEHKKGANGE